MKLLTSQQLRQCDQYTIEHEPISSLALMERAAMECLEWISVNIESDRTIKIFCGTGNNGGDGLAIARLLFLTQKFRSVNVYIVGELTNGSEDFLTNLNKWKSLSNQVFPIQNIEELPALNEGDIVIDAIFGTGLNRPAAGIHAETIEYINSHSLLTISIDLPSGMFAEDNSTNKRDYIIRATYTLSFQCPKLAFLLADCGEFAGEWYILDIGLSNTFIDHVSSPFHLTEREEMRSIIMKRPKFSHKGSFGHALIAAGSQGKMGAAVLAVDACLRSGAGLVTSLLPAGGLEIMQISNPEAMAICSNDENTLIGSFDFSRYSAIGVGPGIGTSEGTTDFLEDLLSNNNAPLVLDADALNIISEKKDLFSLIKEGTILTPHPKEFDRLFGPSENAYLRLLKQQQASVQFKITIVLKGAYTSISSPEGIIYFNSTGNSSLSTGGSGDALTGMICALLAQGYSFLPAARIGVYVHGLTADIWKAQHGNTPMTASDIVHTIPDALKALID